MPSIYRYRKVIDAFTTHQMLSPGDIPFQELCTLEDGYTYVSVPDGAALPEQPSVIAASVEAVALTDELRERIKGASPHCQRIAERVVERIREKYDLNHELYLARIAVGALQGTYVLRPGEAEWIAQYQVDVEAAREWGRQQRAELGL
ncbi:MAG TPA: hypothetical protein VNL74_00930 [Methylococcus sp.]|nr:hypothetical protein [Methylococcus sp.]